MKIFLYIWQLPQNILGLLLIFILGARKNELGVYTYTKNLDLGISLGNYIITWENPSQNVVKHEKGHQRQSIILGPLYLLIVGFPSLAGNIYDRIFHKRLKPHLRIKWYHNRFPENWADTLGGVAHVSDC